MPLPSPFRAIWGYAVVTWLLGALFAVSLVGSDPLGALLMGVGFPLLGSFALAAGLGSGFLAIRGRHPFDGAA